MSNTAILHHAARELERYLRTNHMSSVMADDLEALIKGHAVGAAAASAASGFLPGIGGVVASAVSIGFIWSMYYRICVKLNIKISKNAMKALASAVASNILAGILSFIAIATIATFIPGAGALLWAIVDFGMVYIAGVVFLILLTKLFKAKVDIGSSNVDNLKTMASEIVGSINIKDAYKEAKSEYKTAKQSGEIDKSDTKPLDD